MESLCYKGTWIVVTPGQPGCNQPDQAPPDRDDRSDAGSVDKGLEGALVRDARSFRVPGRSLLGGAEFLPHGINAGFAAVFLDVIRPPQGFGSLSCVHLGSSVSIPFQSRRPSNRATSF
jgi:hypothetical protein